MSSMRVYEFSKQHNIPTKELMHALQEAGHEVKSHMAKLDEAAYSFLEKKFLKANVAPKQETSAIVTSKPLNAKVESTVSKQFATPTNVSKVSRSSGAPFERPQEKKNKIVHQAPRTFFKEKEVAIEPEAEITSLVVQAMTPADMANAIKKPVNDIVLTLLKWGIVAPRNQMLPVAVVTRLAEHYGLQVIAPAKQAESVVARTDRASKRENERERLPVVVVVGHVDHGKTTLLDFVRKTRVASREKGGITQHLGAYQAHTPQGDVVFLDTPGHEAFSKMRMRGLHVADLAILVVAADDGVKPQTIEALKFAQSLQVPIVVALNKADKVSAARIAQVENSLPQYGLVPESLGGDVVCVALSAKTGQGVDNLLEMIVLLTKMQELTADVAGAAEGTVLEARIEKGRGAIGTFIARQGSIHVGDYFLCGNASGRVTSLINSYGKNVDDAGPSVPVLVAGFNALPEAGDFLHVVTKDEYLRDREKGVQRKATAGSLLQQTGESNAIPILVKTDTNSSKEALVGSIAKLNKKVHRGFFVLQAGAASVTESDVEFAADAGAMIYTLHVKIDQKVALLAKELGVKIKSFDIIYKLLEDLEAYTESTKKVVMVQQKVGEASVKKVFDIKGIGVIAGCYVRDGRIVKDGKVKVWRGKTLVGEGVIKTLQRDKKSVKEVSAGFECGFVVDGLRDWAEDDRVECFIEVPENEAK